MKGNQKNKTILIVDGNNLLFRCYFKFAGMFSKSGKPSSVLFGYPYVLKSLITKFKPYKVYNVFDGSRSKKRLEILPTYKQKDPKLGLDIEDLRNQKSLLMKILPAFNTYVVWEKYQEADDLIYLLTRKLKDKYDLIIVSSDKDFNQLITPTIICHNPNKGIEITEKNIKHRFGYEPHQCVDYLIMDGDSSDNIPGYKGMGEKRITDFLNQYASIAYYLSNNLQYKKLNNALLAEVYKRNKYLIDLAYYYRKFNRGKKVPYIGKPKFDRNKIWRFASIYDINTFNKKDFLQTYKTLNQ